MELFYDYVSDTEVDSEYHRRRMEFEAALPPALRRGMYGALVSVRVSDYTVLATAFHRPCSED